MTRDSDIDLLVVSPAPANTIEEHVELRRSLRGLGFPFDVFIIETEKFEESKNIFGGIAYPARRHHHRRAKRVGAGLAPPPIRAIMNSEAKV
jgi:predicted nucleotidyltransferase